MLRLWAYALDNLGAVLARKALTWVLHRLVAIGDVERRRVVIQILVWRSPGMATLEDGYQNQEQRAKVGQKVVNMKM